jgi:plastocyanin
MARPRTVLLALVALLALGMAACTPGEEPVPEEDRMRAADREDEPDDEEVVENGEPEAVVTFVAVDIDFEEHEKTAPAGTLTFELINEGAILHDVAIEELGDEIIVEAQPGETETGTVTLEPGTYTYFCAVPGHQAAGMEGTLTVEG